ncbi:MAG: hypothetical protein J7K75_03715 [Desulfuromonas sp.]|nr:hypothetical protein [Desulfuromonas sp.]
MFVLPRGKTVKENLDPSRLKMPDALLKLCSNSFSGYLSFDGEISHGIICYEEGKISAALWMTGSDHLAGEQAVEQIFRMIQGEPCQLAIYRLDQRLAALIRKTCEGKVEFEHQAMTLVDVDRLLSYLEATGFSGCLRLHVESKVAMIFYRRGEALGFFHDGAVELSLNAPIKQSLAAVEHCQLDVIRFVAQPRPEHSVAGLNLEKSWLKVWRELNP